VAKEASEKTLEELAQDMCFRADSLPHLTARAEITRRQTKAQLDACAAQISAATAERDAAQAAVATAHSTEKNATYMLWSVIIATISAIASAVSAIAAWYAVTHSAQP
jgi:hypothetical protein